MSQERPATHCASALCPAPAQRALDFLADGRQLGRWALGCWGAVAEAGQAGGLLRGHSLFDDRPCWVRPVVAGLTVVYHVGAAPDALKARIWARVKAVAAPDGAAHCRISLHAERAADMDDARWLRLRRCHDLEVLLIQSRLALAPGAPLS